MQMADQGSEHFIPFFLPEATLVICQVSPAPPGLRAPPGAVEGEGAAGRGRAFESCPHGVVITAGNTAHPRPAPCSGRTYTPWLEARRGLARLGEH